MFSLDIDLYLRKSEQMQNFNDSVKHSLDSLFHTSLHFRLFASLNHVSEGIPYDVIKHVLDPTFDNLFDGLYFNMHDDIKYG